MHDFFTPVTTTFRRHPCWLNLECLGYYAAKEHWVRQTFATFNFSFILSGTGEYHTANRRMQISAPCVITQWPGVHVEYGPTSRWEEMYLIYPPSALPRLQELRYAQPGQPFWHIQDSLSLRSKVAEITKLQAAFEEPGHLDVIDRLAEQMILESWHQMVPQPASQAEKSIRRIAAVLQQRPFDQHDVHQLAREYGLTPATFRRHWAHWIGPPPLQYLTRLRLQEACRLLIGSDLSVAEIASRTGFPQPLYFSRKFRQLIGCTATDYRSRHRGAGDS